MYTALLYTLYTCTHPLYRYPNAYNDVSVIELGRRIEFDYKKFGDSPTCLDQGKKKSVGR